MTSNQEYRPKPILTRRGPNDAYSFIIFEAYKKPTIENEEQKTVQGFYDSCKYLFSENNELGLGKRTMQLETASSYFTYEPNHKNWPIQP